MAKSEKKSKWKRKFRALKRVRNNVKETIVLQRVTANINELVEPIGADKIPENGKFIIFLNGVGFIKIYLSLFFNIKSIKMWRLKRRARSESTTRGPNWTSTTTIRRG
jgi:hypothetical protein